MNNKSAPNELRLLLRKMRGENFDNNNIIKETKKDLSMRDLLKITRKLNEEVKNEFIDKSTIYDQQIEEDKFKKFFDDLNVNVEFEKLRIYDNLVFWGGTIDNEIQFVYKVAPTENASGMELNYLDDFNPDNPENDEIIKKLTDYYDIFYKYWRDNIIQK